MRAGRNPRAITVTDVDGDGRLDVVVANQGGDVKGSIGVLLNRGDGAFAPVASHEAGPSFFSLAAADMDGDGKSDILAISVEYRGVWVLLNEGTATSRLRSSTISTPRPSSLRRRI